MVNEHVTDILLALVFQRSRRRYTVEATIVDESDMQIIFKRNWVKHTNIMNS